MESKLSKRAGTVASEHLILLILVVFAVEVRATVNCKYNEFITVDIVGNQSCVACPRCPAGHGLTPQCGSFIKYGGRFGCEPCINRESYSTSNDISSCSPCGICTDHQTIITRCNKTHNSKCGKSCEKGFYYREETFDCQECSWCCKGSGSSIKDCKVSGVPFYKQCSVDDSLQCQPRCSDKEFVYVDKSLNKTCLNCPNCDIGKGLTPKCSSVITSESEPKCLTCDSGKTFSDEQDSSSCKHCTACEFGKKIERLCNTTHDTLCGDCKHGFYEDKKTCKKCSFCCGDNLDTRVPECKAQGMPVDVQCAYTERAVTKCHPPRKTNVLLISLIGVVAAALVLCVAAAFIYYYRCRNRRPLYGHLEKGSSEDVTQHTSGNHLVQEPPSGHSTPTNLEFRRSGVKVMCDAPEVGQELLEKMSVEVCWGWDHYPELIKRQVLLSPVIKLHPQGHQAQKLRLKVLHSAHYDDQNQNWSVAVLNSNHFNGDTCPSEWTDLSALQDIEVTADDVEFSVNDLGTYVVVGTPGHDQPISKKRMCFAVFGVTEPRVGCPYSINLYLLDDCEPSYKKIKDEEESQGRQLMANLRLLHPDVHPKSSINVSIENVSDGWKVASYKPQKFHCKDWLDSYRRIPKIEAIFEHNDTKRKDFRCLFKLKINDTTTMEVPVMHYVKDYMSETLSTGIQVSDWYSSGVTPVLESSFRSPTAVGSPVPLVTLTKDEIDKLSQSVDGDSVESFARKIIPDITDNDIALIRASVNPTTSLLDMVKRRNMSITDEDFGLALKQAGIQEASIQEPLLFALEDGTHNPRV